MGHSNTYLFLLLLNFFLKIVQEDIIEPIIEQCIETYNIRYNYRSDNIIKVFRQRALNLAYDTNSYNYIKQKLHHPTIQLRSGIIINQDRFLQNLQQELQTFQQQSTTMNNQH